ncbi:uncharacterized protein [Nicotiana tomentosiformis]|uniref:uncharacterized protein isoform X4 n=1 Tax=Nicotiana tomentosiformis TaxID=4098 RepID=UPI00144873A8|nr:uncharacterized protein LOC104120441 isoform X4 [Nicotiana tomentosiformis]
MIVICAHCAYTHGRKIEEYKLEHMWQAVTDKFDSDNINDQRDHVLKHMRKLWNNWKGSMHKNIKYKPFRDTLRDVPEGVDKSDWEWLVKEHFLTEKFKGGKDGNPPDMATIFFETRKKDDKLVEPETNEKYVVERCFGPQRKSHIVGFGGGITAKELKGSNSSKVALLEKLSATEKENESLKGRMEGLESKCEVLESKYVQLASAVFNLASSSSSSE